MKPDFVLIGAMKCATSTVSAYLEDHPKVFMARGEPRFFSDDANWARGPAWYAQFFAGHDGKRLCGEGSNDYAAGARFPESAARMAGFCPDARLIYMVRHPLQRIASAYVQKRVDGGDRFPTTLEAAVRKMPERFLDESFYWRNLGRYRARFPDARIFIGFVEDMQTDQAAFFDRLTGFLGVAPAAEIRRAHVNSSAPKRVPSPLYSALGRLPGAGIARRLLPRGFKKALRDGVFSQSPAAAAAMSPALRAELAEMLRPDTEALLAHCGKPRDFWKL